MNDKLSSEAQSLLSLATSGDEVSPNDADRARVRKRVGIALAATSAAGVAASAGSASAAAGGAGGVIAGGVAAGGGLGVKAMIVVALVAGVVGVGALSVPTTSDSSRPDSSSLPSAPTAREAADHISEVRPTSATPIDLATAPSAAPATPALAVPEGPGGVSEDAVRPEVSSPERSARAQPVRARFVEPAALEEPPSMSLGDELGLLRAAQHARVQGDFNEALRQLSEHERRFPTGRLAAERDGTRVFVLCDASRTEEATRARQGFLRDHATSPLAHRVRNGCD